MRVGQPGMKREERHLYGERNEEAKEEQSDAASKPGTVPLWIISNRDKIEAAGLGIKPKNRSQHKHRTDHGEEEIFHSGIDFAPMAIHANQQGHRDQYRFPEEKSEQEQVERGKYADQRRFSRINENRMKNSFTRS